MKQHTSVGIDIGTSITRVVGCEHGDGLPRIIGAGLSDTRGMRHGYVVNREEAAASIKLAIKEAEEASGIRIRQAALAIGGIGLESVYANGSSVVTRADGIIGKTDIDRAIAEAEAGLELKNKVILHAYPISFKVDG